MPYQSTVINSFASLHQTIRTFLIANGWANHSATVIGKGRVRVELADDATWNDQGWLRVCIGKSADAQTGALVDRFPREAFVSGGLASPAFPMTAHLHLHPTRPEFCCALNYAGDKWEHLMFGELVRATDYPGGVYFFASAGNWDGVPSNLASYSNRRFSLTRSVWAPMRAASVTPFAFGQPKNELNQTGFGGTGVWAEPGDEVLAGRHWFGSGDLTCSGLSNELSQTLFERSVNNWNDSVTLVPVRVAGHSGSPSLSFDLITVPCHSLLGQPDLFRYVQLKHLDPGQVLTLGSERWSVYPVERKTNSLYPAKGEPGSGWVGIAVRLDDGGA